MPDQGPDATIQQFRATWERRLQAQRDAGEKRRQHALTEAQRLAALLASEFRVARVRLFGSTLEPGRFNQYSDIDLGVDGLDPLLYYRAQGRLLRESPFSVDLVLVEEAPPLLRSKVEGGIVLYERGS